MNTADRRQFILDRIEAQGAGTYEELATALGVSTMTVRRDLEELIQQGAVIKTVGGVQKAAAPSYLYETALHSRLALRRQEKRAIARRALELITAGSTIFLDGSSTCLELARALAKHPSPLTIVTNSALACLELGENSAHTIVGIGGHYDANSLSYVGPQAEDWAKTLFVDVAFVGTKGLIPTKGTFESSLPTFRIKQIIAKQCTRLVLLADHSKFGQRGLSKVLDIGQIHTVVTDDRTSRTDLGQLEKRVRQVIVAPVRRATLKGAAHAA